MKHCGKKDCIQQCTKDKGYAYYSDNMIMVKISGSAKINVDTKIKKPKAHYKTRAEQAESRAEQRMNWPRNPKDWK